jgi:hypothetical protein
MPMGSYIAISLIVIGGLLVGGGSYLLLKVNAPVAESIADKYKDL